MAGFVNAVFGQSIVEDGAETEIPPRLDSWYPVRSQLLEKGLKTQILGQWSNDPLLGVILQQPPFIEVQRIRPDFSEE